MKRFVTISLALLIVSAGASLAATATPHHAKHHARTTLHPKVSLESATATAMAQVPGGKIKSHELEKEKGKLIYSFDFEVPGKAGIEEVNIDAMTGKLLVVEHETPKNELKEKVMEKHEAKPGH